MRLIQTSILFFIFSFGLSHAQSSDPFNAVQKMFAAMSAYDYDAMHRSGTDDYQLLEDGEIWDMNRLVEGVKGGEGFIERRNYFSVINQVITGDTAWVTYWNRADLVIKDDDNDRSLKWLESAVIKKIDGQWKVQMLHSSPVRLPKTIPEEAEMEEYVQ